MTRAIVSYSAILILVLGGAYACVHEVFRVEYSEILVSEPTSPDGAWKAQVYEEWHEGPFVTVVDDSVRLVSTSAPRRSAVMLFVPHPPTIEWTSSRALHVYVFRSLELKVLRCEFEGVHLDIELGADDAENRAAVYAARGEPDPDPGAASARRCSQQTDYPVAPD